MRELERELLEDLAEELLAAGDPRLAGAAALEAGYALAREQNPRELARGLRELVLAEPRLEPRSGDQAPVLAQTLVDVLEALVWMSEAECFRPGGELRSLYSLCWPRVQAALELLLAYGEQSGFEPFDRGLVERDVAPLDAPGLLPPPQRPPSTQKN